MITKKEMTCKKCGKKVFGRGPDMYIHLQRECDMNPKGKAYKPITNGMHNGTFDPLVFSLQLRGIDIAALEAELVEVDKRRLAIKDVLQAAKAVAAF